MMMMIIKHIIVYLVPNDKPGFFIVPSLCKDSWELDKTKLKETWKKKKLQKQNTNQPTTHKKHIHALNGDF